MTWTLDLILCVCVCVMYKEIFLWSFIKIWEGHKGTFLKKGWYGMEWHSISWTWRIGNPDMLAVLTSRKQWSSLLHSLHCCIVTYVPGQCPHGGHGQTCNSNMRGGPRFVPLSLPLFHASFHRMWQCLLTWGGKARRLLGYLESFPEATYAFEELLLGQRDISDQNMAVLERCCSMTGQEALWLSILQGRNSSQRSPGVWKTYQQQKKIRTFRIYNLKYCTEL